MYLFNLANYFSFREIHFLTSFEKVSFSQFKMFEIRLPTYFFTKENLLKTASKRSHIPLLINQFVSLI